MVASRGDPGLECPSISTLECLIERDLNDTRVGISLIIYKRWLERCQAFSHPSSQKKQNSIQVVNPFLERVNIECPFRIDECRAIALHMESGVMVDGV